ncbi:MAG: AAA family ATPase [Muribaculaceae bacterium]|nr:AAA family ATPase [Muribaculaceae bacterium]
MRKTMYLVAGPNGSGKTTLARELVTDEDTLFLNADEIAAALNDKVGIQAGKILLNQINETISAGRSFVLESTISGKYHLDAIKRAKQKKYNIILIYVFLDSVKQNLARIQMRVKLGGHNVPKTDVIRRYNRSLQNFWELSDIIPNWDLYYNGDSKFHLVARKGTKKLEILDTELYNKIKKTQ